MLSLACNRCSLMTASRVRAVVRNSAPSGMRNFPIRCLSSATPPPSGEDETPPSGRSRILSSILTPQNQFYALVAGGTVGAYALSRIVLSFTSFFTHLNHVVVAKWGFYTGFGTATFLGGTALVVADNLYIRADPVYRYCKNWVVNDSQVKTVLGDGIETGSLRSYRLDAGKFEIPTGTTTPVWLTPRIQMVFDVRATGPPYRTGLVTCEATKSSGFPPRLETTLLMVDYETQTGHDAEEQDKTLFLKGTQEQLDRVSERSGMSLAMLASQVHINKAADMKK